MIATPDDELWSAIGDPSRCQVLDLLVSHGEVSASWLAERVPFSRQAVSKHLAVLERSGLITRSRQAQFRPCHLERPALDAAVDWIEANRRLWSERFDKLDDHLRTLQAPSNGDLHD